MKILFIYASPTIESNLGSISSLALDIFKKIYLEKNPNDEIINLDLNSEEVGIKTLTAYNFNDFFSDGLSDKHIDILKSVDKIVLSSPMTNFNYPAVLKNYLDHILVANKTFKYKYDGKGASEGLLSHLKVQFILTQGAPTGWYLFASHVKSLKGTFEFIGAQVLEPILIDGTKAPNNINKTREEQVNPYISKIKKAVNYL